MSIRQSVIDAVLSGGHKITKADAHYSRGMGESRCRNCTYFRLRAGVNVCRIVIGYIDPSDWCKYYRKREAGSE